MRISLILLFAFIHTVAKAQQITGKVSDSDLQPLVGAGVYILNPVDSSIITGSTTDTVGNFLFRFSTSGKFLVRTSFLGFKDHFIEKEFSGSSINLGNVVLKNSTSTLNEVTVSEKVIPVQIKGDTTEYNADAFKTNKDATTEDLVQKMPGITTQDGKIQAQGEEVKKVLIDGKPFLGDDPNAAMKNLPAEVVEKIQVFDKKSDQSEFTGFDDGNSSKTINIITRPQFRNGIFGKVAAGLGSEESWKAGMSVNFFKDKRKLTILGNSNNINEQNFSTDDLLGVMSTSPSNRVQGQRGTYSQRGGSSGRGNQPSDASNFLIDQRNGVSETNSAGFNYANQFKKADFSVSYFFNHTYNRSTSDLYRQYLSSEDFGLNYAETSTGRSTNINHRANLRLDYKFDTLNSILFQPRISFQDNSGNSLLSGVNSEFDTLLSDIENIYGTAQNGYSFSAPLLYRHSFHKKGRTFSANINAGYSRNEGENQQLSQTTYYADSIPSDTINQITYPDTENRNFSGELTYTEPLSSKEQLSFTYKSTYTTSESDKTTFTDSILAGEYRILDTTLSNKFSSVYPTQSIGAGYRFQEEKWNLSVGLAYQTSALKNEQEFPYQASLDKSFNSFLPNAMFQYKFTQRKNLRMFYRSSNNSPSVTQLQNVINNNNPLQLTTGNPDLKQDWQNYVNVRYSAANTEKNTSFFIFISGNVAQDYIANSTFVATSDSVLTNGITLASGSQISKPVNLDDYYNLRSFCNYSFPLGVFKSSLNLNGNLNYSNTPSIVNNIKSSSKTTGAGLGFSISSNISEKYDFLLSSNGSFSNVKSSLETNPENNSFNLASRLRIQVNPWKGLILQTEFNHQYNSGLSESYNQNYTLWNAAVGYKFLKNKVAEIRLSAFDILNQNTSISRNTTDIYYEDIQTNTIEQYFMLTFTYNLKFFKMKKEEGG
jgi:hypothetical protein